MTIDHHHYTREKILSWGRYRRAHFMQSLVGPRAMFLVGTVNADGRGNAAPFNTVQHLSAEPPQISILVRPEGDNPRHTMRNILETRWFTLNSVSPGLIERAHHASAKYTDAESEFEHLDIPVFYSPTHKVPYVEESRFCLGVELAEQHTIGHTGSTLLVGDVREVYAPAVDVKSDGHMGPTKHGPVVVSGLDHYGKVRSIERMDYPAKVINPSPK